MGHGGLPSKAQWSVHVSLYQAVLPRPTAAHMPSPPKTADEVLVQLTLTLALTLALTLTLTLTRWNASAGRNHVWFVFGERQTCLEQP